MVPRGHTCVTPQTRACTASMSVVEWYISDELASMYSAVYDSGRDSFMAKWRAQKRSNRFKPERIPLEAWVLLEGPFKGHRAVIGRKPKKEAPNPKRAQEPPPKLVSGRSNKSPQYTYRTVTDVSAQCLQELIGAGYGEEQACDLVSRCKDLKSVMYDNRPQATRRLTLPDEPTNRCTSFVQWVQAVLQKHPPSTPTGCL